MLDMYDTGPTIHFHNICLTYIYLFIITVIHYLFKYIFNGLEERYGKELGVVRGQYPSAPVRFTDAPLIIHWDQAMDMLTEAGELVGAGLCCTSLY